MKVKGCSAVSGFLTTFFFNFGMRLFAMEVILHKTIVNIDLIANKFTMFFFRSLKLILTTQ